MKTVEQIKAKLKRNNVALRKQSNLIKKELFDFYQDPLHITLMHVNRGTAYSIKQMKKDIEIIDVLIRVNSEMFNYIEE